MQLSTERTLRTVALWAVIIACTIWLVMFASWVFAGTNDIENPPAGTVDFTKVYGWDTHWYTPKGTIRVAWEPPYYTGKLYDMELWTCIQPGLEPERWAVVPVARGEMVFDLVDVPIQYCDPVFYLRNIETNFRTQWVVEMHELWADVYPPQNGQAWVWNAGTHRFELRTVVTKGNNGRNR